MEHTHKRRRIKPPQTTRRPRSSDSKQDIPASKRIRTRPPPPPPPTEQRGSKRSIINDHHQINTKRLKKHHITTNTRSKNSLKSIPKPTPSSSHRLNPTPSGSSSSNFIPTPEFRTRYARDVAEAEKNREEGNKFYTRKEYQQAIRFYAQALERYPRQPLPGEPYHPGFSTTLANLGSTYMALSEYRLGAIELKKSIEAVEITPLLPQETRKILIKRLFRLARCHLALLDSQAAAATLSFAQDPRSPVNITPNDSGFIAEFSSLFQRSSFLVQAEDELHQARADLQWETVLDLVQNTQLEVLRWGFNLNPDFLPGFWPFAKAEALARLGKPLEAEAILSHVKHPCPFPSDLKMIEALICLASANLDEADAKLGVILNKDLGESTARFLAGYVKGLQSRWSKIKSACDRRRHLTAADQCEYFLAALVDPITLTLRIKTYTIMCEQLLEHSLQVAALEYHLAHRIMDTTTMVLAKYVRFAGASPGEDPTRTYAAHRKYVIRLLLARARATVEVVPRVSKATYALLLELLQRTWPTLAIRDRTIILAEIQARIGVSDSNRRPHHSHQSPQPQNPCPRDPSSFPPWDPKGYYQILQVHRNASVEEIKKAFRGLSLKHHPDKGGQTEFFQDINLAYQVLGNPRSRNSYDAFGR